MSIEYKINQKISVQQFIDVLVGSSLGERRPISDIECIKGMLKHSNLLVSAWDKDNLVGVARSVTDFHYACYLSDLAVLKSHQRLGIGKQLQLHTQQAIGNKCKIILLAAPAASDYYPKLGYTHNPRCWVLDDGSSIIH